MTISLAAVFIPVLFMGGIVGRLLHEFAVTIVVAILISGFVSLTLDADAVQPLPEARSSDEKARQAFQRVGRRASTGCCSGYDRTLQIAMRSQLRHADGFVRGAGAGPCTCSS